jgi:hypothetical protein
MRRPGGSDRTVFVVYQIAFAGKSDRRTARSYGFESINKFVNNFNL